MKFKLHPCFVFAFSGCALLVLVQTACDITSGNDTVRNVSINISGTYRNDNGIPRRQSGAVINSLALTQAGDQLFAIDNEGTRWTGRIGRADGNRSASISLKGRTTTGNEVVMTGNVVIDGTSGRMTGIWVEPGFTSEFSAQAEVAPQPEPQPTPSPTPPPSNGNGGNTNGTGGTGGGTGGTTNGTTPPPPTITFPPIPG
ncbi:MAG: hypothetical protein JJU29_06780 [Verrucomicrobia bacterium]|nr:hypothetical protein [Verrucomicrobiota bacterium]MCH8511579.1 hypothetical protein [Kiritimatiellia bacterium]